MTENNKRIAEILDTLNKPITAETETTAEALAVELGLLGNIAMPAISNLLASNDADRRFWAARALWANGSVLAQEHLIALLNDPDEMIRSVSALALGELKSETAIASLANLMTTDSSAAGDHAADALAKIGLPAEDILIAALQNPEASVRLRAAKALVPVESKKAIKPLIDALDHDESYLVRHFADEALKRMGVGQMIYFK